MGENVCYTRESLRYKRGECRCWNPKSCPGLFFKIWPLVVEAIPITSVKTKGSRLTVKTTGLKVGLGSGIMKNLKRHNTWGWYAAWLAGAKTQQGMRTGKIAIEVGNTLPALTTGVKPVGGGEGAPVYSGSENWFWDGEWNHGVQDEFKVRVIRKHWRLKSILNHLSNWIIQVWIFYL